ncbi:hypothetical protein QL285_061694 [Trifolium repens]|nr:hypothetical protein QL285_061694 [Trifolium repens]
MSQEVERDGAVYSNGSETQEPLAKMTREEKGHQDEQLRSGESICKIISKEQILPQEERRKTERHAQVQVWGEITMLYETAPGK